jgi:hypothetical protein
VTRLPVPGPALRALHLHMATLGVRELLFQVTSALPDVPVQVLNAACDPASPVLLAWPIYRGIAAACGAGERSARVRAFYVKAKAERDLTAAGDRHSVVALPATAVPHPPVPRSGSAQAGQPGRPVPLAEQATVPKLRLPHFPRRVIPTALQQIRTRADYADYLKDLIRQARLTLRAVEDRTGEIDEAAVSRRSTLSDTLRNGKVSTNERVMKVLLTAIFSELEPGKPDLVAGRVAEALQTWRQIAHTPPGAPVLTAAAEGALLDHALEALAHAEHTAQRLGTPDAPGLAHAQQILRELLT